MRVQSGRVADLTDPKTETCFFWVQRQWWKGIFLFPEFWVSRLLLCSKAGCAQGRDAVRRLSVAGNCCVMTLGNNHLNPG